MFTCPNWQPLPHSLHRPKHSLRHLKDGEYYFLWQWCFLYAIVGSTIYIGLENTRHMGSGLDGFMDLPSDDICAT